MKKLLIVVDYQNDFVSGSLGFKDAKAIEPLIEAKIKEYEDVIFTLDIHDNDYLNTLEGKFLPIEHCIEGTLGAELYGDIKKYQNKATKIFKKNTFPSLELANYLKKTDYEYIELVGLVSNICVLSNAVMVKSALPNARIIVDSTITDSSDKKLHKEAMDVLKGLHIEVK